jgi:hypothetical protein
VSAAPRDRAYVLGLTDLTASVTAATAGILTGLFVGVLGVLTFTLAVASAMGLVALIACRPRPAPAAPLADSSSPESEVRMQRHFRLGTLTR